LERHFGYAAALAAGRFEHFALLPSAAAAVAAAASATGGFARRTTVAAPARLIRKAFARVKFLLACGEREAASAIDAIKVFI
jgi:hypothetical protein